MGRAAAENFYITVRETSSVRRQQWPIVWWRGGRRTSRRRRPRPCCGPPSSADDGDDHDDDRDGVSVRSCDSDTQQRCRFDVNSIIVVRRTACTRIRLCNIIIIFIGSSFPISLIISFW